MKAVLLTSVVALLCTGSLVAGRRAQLDVKAERIGTLLLSGAQGRGAYLYFTYSVSNPTDKEMPLYLDVALETEQKDTAYRNAADASVQSVVEQKLNKKYLNISDARSTKIGPGETKDCIAIFGKIDPAPDFLNVVIRGIADRVTFEGGKRIVEDKALVFKYWRPGDEYHPLRWIRPNGKEWRVDAREEKPYR